MCEGLFVISGNGDVALVLLWHPHTVLEERAYRLNPVLGNTVDGEVDAFVFFYV